MKVLLKALVLFVLVLALIVPIFAQEVTPEAVDPIPTIEVVEGVEPVVLAPVAVAPAADGVSELLSPELMVITGSIVLAIGLGGAFYVLLKALDALKVSVPQEVMTVYGNQIAGLIHETRQFVGKKVSETASPVDDMVWSIANVPLDVLEKEIQRRSSPPPAPTE
jgi:hypothetical protein